MRRHIRFILPIASALCATEQITASPAREILLYDCDYSDSPALLGQRIPHSSGPFPGRTECSSIVFGDVLLEQAPTGWTGTSAVMRSNLTNDGPLNYSQMQFDMFAGGVYVFRRHRIDMTFQFMNPASPSGSGLTILTDGGVGYSLSFASSGTMTLLTNVMEYDSHWGDRVVTQTTQIGSFDPAAPVHLIWETDVNGGSTTLTINETVNTFTGLSPRLVGLRNWRPFPGPLFIRISLSDVDSDSPVALQSVRITASDYDGPLYEIPVADSLNLEKEVAVVPLSIPDTGTWQPQYSTDGTHWETYGAPISAESMVESVRFGTLVAPQFFFRMSELP